MKTRRIVWPLVAIGSALVGIALGYSEWRAREVLDSGLALRADDLRAGVGAEVDVVREALALDAHGDRGAAAALLQEVALDGRASHIPALLLAEWRHAAGDTLAARNWLSRAQAAPIGRNDRYAYALLDFVTNEMGGESAERLRTADALLALRPEAWRVRLARAHIRISSRHFSDALDDLKQVPVKSLNDRRMAWVVADRASLGDPDGAEQLLNGLRADAENPAFELVRGRIAFARGELDEALRHYDAAAMVADRGKRPDMAGFARDYAALISAESGDWADANRRMNALIEEWLRNGRPNQAAETALLLAAVCHFQGDAAGRDRALSQVVAHSSRQELFPRAFELEFVRLALAAPPIADAPAPEEIPESSETLGLMPLLSAWRAYRDGDPALAGRHLAESQTRGVAETYFAEAALLLAVELGAPLQEVPRVDPPFPVASRHVMRWALLERRR